MRGKIVLEHRQYTSAQGLAIAERHKKTTPSLNHYLDKYAQEKYKLKFTDLNENQKSSIYYEIIKASGRDNVSFTTINKRLVIIGKVTVLVTATIATYQILNAENQKKEAIKQGVQISTGIAGGWLAGLAVTPICGPGAPFCAIAVVLIGSAAGGLAGFALTNTLDEEIEEFTKWEIF